MCTARKRLQRKTVQLSSVQCCFTSTESIRTVRNGGEPRTATSTFTQLLNSNKRFDFVSELLYVHSNH